MVLPPWHPHPDVLLVLGGLEAGYLWALRRRARRSSWPGTPAATAKQVWAFTAGIAVLLVASQWPMHDLAEGFLFSVHMVQHTLISLVAPPLILFGMPDWMLRRLLAPRVLNATARQLTRPLIAFLLFNSLIVLTHWPPVVELTLRDHPFHLLMHVVLFGAASLMWWPVIAPLPEMPGLTYPGRMLYLFLQSVVPTVPASFLTFGSTPLYPFYAEAPRIWGVSVLTDQLVAGLIMKIVGGLILWVGIGVVFFRWFAVERSGWDALAVGRVDREIRSELSKR